MTGSTRHLLQRLALIAGTLACGLRTAAPQVLLNELLASNSDGLTDEDGDRPDWIELRNAGTLPVSLGGWYLTDNASNPRKWAFPPVEIAAGGFLVVFASGKDRAAPGMPLHTSFSLDAGGEHLALVRPDGVTIEHGYSPSYPLQRTDVSYGLFADVTELLKPGDPVDWSVPAGGGAGPGWTLPDFSPGAEWRRGASGVGYYVAEGGGLDPDTISYWPLDGDLDDHARGNHAAYRGGASPAFVAGFDGSAGGAIQLGGADYLEISGANGIPVFNEPEYTLALWVKGSPQQDRRVYAEGSTTDNDPLFTIGTDNGGGTGSVDIFIRTESGTTLVNHAKSSRTAFDGAWHHVAWVDRGGDAALYIDGQRDPAAFGYAKPSLPLNIASIGAVLRASACCFFTGTIDDVAIWSVALAEAEIAALASGETPAEDNPYEGLIATDLSAAMRGTNASVYLRFPFLVADPAGFDSLALALRYEDGLVAYLNGREVARRNAPPAPAWNSAATLERLPREARSAETINLTSHLDALRPGTNVLAIHGLNSRSSDDDFLVLPELAAASSSTVEGRYFRDPTPGSINEGGVIDFVADTKFSADRGFFDAPFLLELSTATPGAVIRYTLDQSAPTATHGNLYSGPIRIDRTTTVRAVAFKEGIEPTNVDTHTYIFLEDVIRQPAQPAGYPTSWQGFPADYAMDAEICTNTASAHYDPRVKSALRSLPTLSLVVDRDDLMGPARGIYTHSLSRGLAWERPASAELIYPDGREAGFQVNCGVRMQGGSSARPGEGKHSFRLVFKSLYGPSKFRYQLFPDSGVDSFDTIVLRCFSTDSWHFKDGGSRYRRWDSQFIRDLWMKDTQLAMGHLSEHNTYVHLYVNGHYWGVYNPCERPDDSFQSDHQGDAAEDWDILKDFNELFRGNRDAWNQLMSAAATGLGTLEAYQRIQGNNPDGSRNPAFPALLDAGNLIDYMLLHFWACSEDWPHHNWYAARSRTGDLGGWRFFVWDQEIVLDFVFRDRLDVNNDNSPAKVYSSLRASPEFRVRFGDNAHRHLFHGGALTAAQARARWLHRADQIDLAVIAESARWGDYRLDVPDPSNSPATLYTREDHWLVEKNKVLDQYIPESHRLLLERLRREGLYPAMDSPTFNQHGGLITMGFELEVSAPAGTIYYTLDGSDPRLVGGGASPAARIAGQGGARALVASGAACRALVPRDGSIGLAWTEAGFADGAWAAGTTGVGLEQTTGYESLIGLDVGAEMYGINASVYVRVPFSLASPQGITRLTLRMKYDDGFVAYLNGAEIARANAPAVPGWSSQAAAPHADSDAVVFQDFDVSAWIGALRAGTNVLAIHGLNASPTSGDLLLLPELTSTETSGAGISLNAPTTVRARAFDGSWSALNEAFFYFDIPLRITEIMYHPIPPAPGADHDADEYEFLEIQNVGNAFVDLTGCRLTGGVELDFDQITVSLPPGEVVLVVENLAAFRERYPGVRAQIVGEYAGRLSNLGESIRLEGPAGEPILEFAYSDLWHPATDGLGPSLITADASAPRDLWGEAAQWLESAEVGGSPGIVESGPQPAGGWQLPCDLNQDASVDISDVVSILFLLFLGGGLDLPCDGGDLGGAGNQALVDVNRDSATNLTDPVFLLNYLFRGGPAPPLGTECLRLLGCPDVCR